MALWRYNPWMMCSNLLSDFSFAVDEVLKAQGIANRTQIMEMIYNISSLPVLDAHIQKAWKPKQKNDLTNTTGFCSIIVSSFLLFSISEEASNSEIGSSQCRTAGRLTWH